MEPVATVGIIAKPDVRQTDELLPALLDWLAARSVGVRLDRDAAGYLGKRDWTASMFPTAANW